MARTLWLIGMMGVGKTAVAPLVAGRLGRAWTDTDAEVARAVGMPAADVLSESEERFRRAERRAVADLAGRPLVVACGGGVVLSEDSVASMRGAGTVVWLRAEPATLARRVGDGSGRPLLAAGVAPALARLDAVRRVRYAEAAHVVVDTDTRTLDEVAEEVERAWLSV